MGSSEYERNQRSYRFPRRFWNTGFFGCLLSGTALLYLSWHVFTALPTLLGAGLTLVGLGFAVFALLTIARQPLRLVIQPRRIRIDYPFHHKRIPFQQIERLHWSRSRSRLAVLRQREVLLIELKDGSMLPVDHMRGQLKRIRGMIEKRVYGPTV